MGGKVHVKGQALVDEDFLCGLWEGGGVGSSKR